MSIMKQIFSNIKVLLFIGIISTTITSCQDFMSTDSGLMTLADGTKITSANDSVYSILGILHQVQKISDKYVLIGELRADLMDITPTSESDLRDLSQFKVDPSTSQFADAKEFYAIINNCNYFIQRVDTNIIVKANKPFVKELAVVKTIRAWAYMQLTLNYGKAIYFKKPILTVQDSKENFPELGPEQMMDSLIADMNTVNSMDFTSLPKYGAINGVDSRFLYIDAKFLMGDLYLWKASFTKSIADYEQAATYYAKLIEERYYVNSAYTAVTWYNDLFKWYSDSWLSSLYSGSELISIAQLAVNEYEGTTCQIALLCDANKLTASKPMDDLSAAQTYCLYDEKSKSSKYYPGDLRIKSALRNDIDDNRNITKFRLLNINFYRKTLLYLRFAEAINRAGKPSLAFAVLKYGLNSATLKDKTKVAPGEISDNKDYVNIFLESYFDSNVGIHNRGCGNSTYNVSYIIPNYTRYSPTVVTDKDGVTLIGVDGNDSIASLPTTLPDLLIQAKADSTLFVENAICDELGLETSFEGNRFQDLMRFSNHRNDPEFLARKVAAKHSNYDVMFLKLKDMNNWYLPTKK